MDTPKLTPALACQGNKDTAEGKGLPSHQGKAEATGPCGGFRPNHAPSWKELGKLTLSHLLVHVCLIQSWSNPSGAFQLAAWGQACGARPGGLAQFPNFAPRDI